MVLLAARLLGGLQEVAQRRGLGIVGAATSEFDDTP